jgi:hypothetical protein
VADTSRTAHRCDRRIRAYTAAAVRVEGSACRIPEASAVAEGNGGTVRRPSKDGLRGANRSSAGP